VRPQCDAVITLGRSKSVAQPHSLDPDTANRATEGKTKYRRV
jgi:hypothetical protein